MRGTVLLCCALLLTACAKGGEQAGGQAGAAPTLNLADMAGTWTVQAMPQDKDSVLVTSQLTTTATTEGWTMLFAGRSDTIPLHVVTGGDSVVMHAGPYESALRKGVTVTTDMVARLVDGQLQGSAVAHYQGAGPDSVLTLRLKGTRAP
jgi:D-alanyl-D-alanine carboxypeptidase